jgi:hypothetical protein
MKSTVQPREQYAWSTAPRCGARNRQGTPCQCPAMRNKRRCRLHGGKSTGPRTPEGLERMRQSKIIHGRHTTESRMERAACRQLMRNCEALWRLGLDPDECLAYVREGEKEIWPDSL